MIREGLRTSLSGLRLAKPYRSSRQRWNSLCSTPALFIVGRERAKLGYFWRHAFVMPRSGKYFGCAANPDSGRPVIVDENRRLTADEFLEAKIDEVIEKCGDQPRSPVHSALWQADRN